MQFLEYCTNVKGFKYSGSRILIWARGSGCIDRYFDRLQLNLVLDIFCLIWMTLHHFNAHSSQLTFTCPRLTIETLENGMKDFVPSKRFDPI